MPEQQDKALKVVGWVFGTFSYVMLVGAGLLPYMAAFPDPGRSCLVAIGSLGAVLITLLAFGAIRSAIGAAQRDKPSWFLGTHQLLLVIPLYLFLGGMGVLLMALVSPIAGWALVGAVLLAALFFAYGFYRCPRCRRLFAAELVLVEKIGERRGTSMARDAVGNPVAVQTASSKHRRTYRCRFCLHRWSR